MKKIAFSDKYKLTQAVLEGRKTMTRRVCKYGRPDKTYYIAFPVFGPNDYDDDGNVKSPLNYAFGWRHNNGDFTGWNIPQYKVGEVVAIAQSYSDCGNMPDFGLDEDGYPIMPKNSGFFNKMFVRANLMPHHIRITDVKVERLQDISDGDCLKEGIEEHLKNVQYGFSSNIGYCGQYPFSNPREAYAALIDKVLGKGTWDSNPYVFVYEFELID